jgi:hypothetical protein
MDTQVQPTQKRIARREPLQIEAPTCGGATAAGVSAQPPMGA